MQNDVYACFIDYTKPFNKVRHKEIHKILQQLHFNRNDIQLTVTLHLDQSTAIRIDNELGK